MSFVSNGGKFKLYTVPNNRILIVQHWEKMHEYANYQKLEYQEANIWRRSGSERVNLLR
jgi:hypothetical protein